MLKRLKIIFFPCKENNYLPHFLEPKFLNYYLVFLLLLKTLTLPLLFFATKTPFFAEISKAVLLQLINQERIKRNLPPLKEDPALEESALLKAQDMLKKDYFAHISPDGTLPWHWLKVAGYNFQMAGENLAIGFLDTREVFEAWMNSFPHRKNLLNPNYKDTGISVLKGEFDGNEVYLVVQHFGKRKIEIIPTARAQTKIEPEKEATSQISTKEIAQKETASQVPEKKENLPQTLSFKFVEFTIKDYTHYLNIFIYLSLFFIILSISLAIFYDIFVWRKFVLDYKYLVWRWISFCLLLFFFLYLNEVKILRIIPHALKIYGI